MARRGSRASSRRRAAPARAEAAGLRRWNALPAARRFAIAVRLVRRSVGAFRAAYGVAGEPPDRPHIVSVGVGHRLARVRRRGAAGESPVRGRPHPSLGRVRADEVCIRFIVREKMEKERLGVPGGARPIPRTIAARTTIRGRRTVVNIPTDVQREAPGRLHGLVDATDGVRVVDRQNAANRGLGSFCCIVRDKAAPSKRYVLSCRHVVCIALAPHGATSPTLDGEVRLRSGAGLVGAYFDAASLGDGAATFGCDAALASLDLADVPVMWTTVPASLAKPLDKPGKLEVFAPRQEPNSGVRPGPLAASGFDLQFDRTLEVMPGLRVRFEAVAAYFAATEPGDSGSGLIDDSGKLFGMHFYEDALGVSYAIPAFVLFRPGLFKINIRL